MAGSHDRDDDGFQSIASLIRVKGFKGQRRTTKNLIQGGYHGRYYVKHQTMTSGKALVMASIRPRTSSGAV
jgi:hypothetical protein